MRFCHSRKNNVFGCLARSLLGVLLVVGLQGVANSVSAESSSDDHQEAATQDETEAVAIEIKKERRPARFLGYQKDKKVFELLCEKIDSDGRLPTFYAMLDENSSRDKACKACRPLIKGMENACKNYMRKKERADKKARSERARLIAEAEEEGVEPGGLPEEPVEPVQQRLPHIDVIGSVSEIFSEYGEREDIEFTYQAVQKLLVALRDPDGKTAAAREYFETLASYIESPFLEYARYLEYKNRKEQKKEKEADRVINVDTLFEF